MPRVEFLANMNISPLTVRDLRMLGWNIVRVPEIMDKKSKDMDILTYARDHNKVVITQDLDFSSLLALKGYVKPSVMDRDVFTFEPFPQLFIFSYQVLS